MNDKSATENKNIKMLKCEKCGGDMKKTRKASHTGVGLLCLLVGIVLVLFFPIGTVFGVIFIIVGLHYGSKTRGMWTCKKCGYQFKRKLKWFEFG